MRMVSSTYQTLRNQRDSYYEVEVQCGSRIYRNSEIYALKINPKLFEGNGPSIGNACASVCNLTLNEQSGNWPRMAEFSARVRLSSEDGQTKSEWLPMGTYYTDERSQDKATGKLSITAFDSMLMNEQYWTDQIPDELLPADWPITAKAWLDILETIGLIAVDSRSDIDDTIPFIGLNTDSTIRDVLKSIAAAHGGNWVVTYENKLRLLQLETGSFKGNAIAGIAIAGISVVGMEDDEYTPPADLDYTNLRLSIQNLTTSPELAPVTGIKLEGSDGVTLTAGTDEGYVLNAKCNFAVTAGIAALCLSRVQGYVYRPFRAERAMLDPAAEIGDAVIIHHIPYQSIEIDWNLHTWPTAGVSAAYEEEVNHEYEYEDEIAKTYKKTVIAIENLEENSVSKDGIISAINQTSESITIQANKVNLTGYITATDVGATGTTVINGSRISGGTLTLGGNGNLNGTLVMKNAYGSTIGEWDKDGLRVYAGTISGLTISGASISGGTIDGASIIGTTIEFRGSIYNSKLQMYSGSSAGSTSFYYIDASYTGSGILVLQGNSATAGWNDIYLDGYSNGVVVRSNNYTIVVNNYGIEFLGPNGVIKTWT